MNIDAQILARMNMPYAVATLRFNLQTFVLLSRRTTVLHSLSMQKHGK